LERASSGLPLYAWLTSDLPTRKKERAVNKLAMVVIEKPPLGAGDTWRSDF
jgi:hypothetical protein